MKAAVVTAPGKTPVYTDFPDPTPSPGQELITVRAAALSNLTRARASGTHYSSAGIFPAVAGTDGVGRTQDGRRVYFAMPEAPFGSLAQLCPIAARRCVPIPDSLDDRTAAAIANPGMSAWAALIDRAHLLPGETVLVNGATGTAGRIAVQLARHLGASSVIATGRNAAELEELKQLGADRVLPFALDPPNPSANPSGAPSANSSGSGAQEFEQALQQIFSTGIDVVVDYLWGTSATLILKTLAATIDDHPVRFVHVGASAGQPDITLPGALLRSSAINLMGSGIGSVSRQALAQSISNVFAAVQPANLQIATKAAPLSDVQQVWEHATGKPRTVFTID